MAETKDQKPARSLFKRYFDKVFVGFILLAVLYFAIAWLMSWLELNEYDEYLMWAVQIPMNILIFIWAPYDVYKDSKNKVYKDNKRDS